MFVGKEKEVEIGETVWTSVFKIVGAEKLPLLSDNSIKNWFPGPKLVAGKKVKLIVKLLNEEEAQAWVKPKMGLLIIIWAFECRCTNKNKR